MRAVDVVVVGAGFSGLECARVAALRGLRTVVLERKPDPGASPHTTGLLVKEVADEWDIPLALTRKIHGVRVYAPSLRWIDLDSPGYYFLATDTSALMRWLCREATSAGAEVMLGSPYRGAGFGAGRVCLRGSDVAARVLVGADGPRSRVASDFGLGLNRKFLVGAEQEWVGVRGVEHDRLHCFLNSRLAPGYIAWVVPGYNVTQVGLACRPPYRPRLDLLVRHLSQLFDFSEARVVASRGGLIPIGGTVVPFGNERVVLVGDAAGLVSPLTAGGIHTAMHYGRRAGQVICDSVLGGGPSPSLALRSVYPTFRWKRLLRAAFDVLASDCLVDALLSNAAVRAAAHAVFFHHRGLLSPAAWREVAHVAWAGHP